MKSGLTISIVGHAALLMWGLVTLAASPYEAPQVESLPVDIVSDAEFSQMTAGAKTAPKAEMPKPLVEKVDEPKRVESAEAKVTDKQEIVTASAEPTPPAQEAKIPEPKPAPAPPEARAEPKEPERSPADAKPDPISDLMKKEKEREKQAEKKAHAAVPKPPRRPPRSQPQPAFDADRIAALLDKRDPQRNAATGEALNRTPSLGTARGNAPQLTQTEIDALRAQIEACWNPPAGAVDGKELIVQVRIMLRPDGSLSGAPVVLNRGSNPFFQVAAESAMRAVRRCQPYRLPIAKYEVWKDVEVTFDPRNLYRG